jgi:V/A-type H+/Na+-transporting ATPase subunit E
MPTTLEDFVAKLHAEGVATGRAEAARLVEEARQEAALVRREAELEAAAMVAQAESEAERIRERSESELRLAARDAVLGLRASLTRSLESILRRAIDPLLADPVVLTELVTLLVQEYARADAAGARRIEIQVPDRLRERVEGWSLQALAASLSGPAPGVDVRGGLAETGFEYRLDGSRVEVTVDAVVEVVRELVRPALWAVLERSLEDGDASAGSPGGGEVGESWGQEPTS